MTMTVKNLSGRTLKFGNNIILNDVIIVNHSNIEDIIMCKYLLLKSYQKSDIIFMFDDEVIDYTQFCIIIDGSLRRKYLK